MDNQEKDLVQAYRDDVNRLFKDLPLIDKIAGVAGFIGISILFILIMSGHK